MDFYKTVDNILDLLTKEYTSDHEPMTKALNYEYHTGQLYFVYNFAQTTLPLDDFIELYSYRREEKDEITEKFNLEIINPIYNVVRSA